MRPRRFKVGNLVMVVSTSENGPPLGRRGRVREVLGPEPDPQVTWWDAVAGKLWTMPRSALRLVVT